MPTNITLMFHSKLLNIPLFLNLGPTEVILIVVVVLLLFGGKKIPELMRGLGQGVREFNDAKNNVKKEIEDSGKTKEGNANNSPS